MPPHSTPKMNAPDNMKRNSQSVRCGARYQYIGNATSVPNVPGALRAKPLPKPNDNRCAGWLSKNRQPGLTNSSPEVVIAASLDVEWIACRIAHETAAPCNDLPDMGQRQAEPRGDLRQFRMARCGSGKAQLVIVATGQDALPCQRLRYIALHGRRQR